MSEETLETLEEQYRILIKDVVNGQRRYVGEIEDVLADFIDEKLKFSHLLYESERPEGYYGSWKVRVYDVPVHQPCGKWMTIRVLEEEWKPSPGYSWSERRIYLLR